MSWPWIVGLVAYGVGALVCFRLVTWSYVDAARRVGADAYEDPWMMGLVVGFLAALIWPLVLLLYRPPARWTGCPVCGDPDQSCQGRVTSACGGKRSE